MPAARQATPEVVPVPPLLGKLSVVDRKTGDVRIEYPLDSELTTIGRDAECDLRIYWDDVSRIHAEIVFDLLEGVASIKVIGSNGLYFIPAGQTSRTKLEPPYIQPLAEGDTFIIRRKLFRFEYASTDLPISVLSPGTLGTPVRTAHVAAASPKPTPVRRRASHRLSLMPADKPFVPLSPMKRRQSNVCAAGSTPKRVGSVGGVAEEDEEDMEGVVEMQRNDDGEVAVLERREEEAPVQETKPAPPKTPRSVPLPPPAQTPYQTPPRVPSKVAMSTPPGPMTLHKALLLRSARKVWVETRPTGIEGAVEEGSVEMRRKSTSPTSSKKAMVPKKSLTPRPSVAVPMEGHGDTDADAEGESDEEEFVEAQQNQQAQPAENVKGSSHEDEAAVFEEGDSAEDSLEADLSLDVADDDEPSRMPTIMVHHSDEHSTAAHEVDVDDIPDMQTEEDEDGDEHEAEATEADPKQNSFTPVSSRILSKFFTPQVNRQQAQPRRSLAGIGGPAVRAGIAPSAFNPLAGGAFRPAQRGVSADDAPPFVDAKEEQQVDDVKPATPVQKVSELELAEIKKRRISLATPRGLPLAPGSFRDPVKNTSFLIKSPSHPALTRDSIDGDSSRSMMDLKSRLDRLRETKKSSADEGKRDRRATVGFALPETPLRPVPKPSASYTGVASSKVGGFDLSRTALRGPETPIIAPAEDTSDISSLTQTPVRRMAKKVGTPFSLVRRSPIKEDPETTPVASPMRTPAKSPYLAKQASPSPSAPAVSKAAVAEPKTSYMKDIRHLYPAIPQPSASPNLKGIKNLYPSVPLPPETPDMRGLRDMFAKSATPATPDMAGMKEMFPSPVPATASSPAATLKGSSPAKAVAPAKGAEEAYDDVGDESEEVQEEIEFRSPVLRTARKPAAAPMQRNVVNEEEGEEEEEEVEEVEHRSPVQSSKSGSRPRPAVVEDKKSTSAKNRKTPAVSASGLASEDVDAKPKTKPARRAGPAEVPIAEPQTTSTSSRTARSRTTVPKRPTAAVVSAPPAEPQLEDQEDAESAPSKRTRAKKILAESNDQVKTGAEPTGDAEQISKPSTSRGRKAVGSTATSTTSAKSSGIRSAPAETAAVTEEKSAPSRRGRAAAGTKAAGKGKAAVVEDKENADEEASVPSAASRSVRSRATAKKEKQVDEVVVPPVTTRATRSRK